MEGEVGLPAQEVGEVQHAMSGPDALHQHGQRLAGIVLLAEEVPVDGVEERLAVTQRRHAHRGGAAEQRQVGSRKDFKDLQRPVKVKVDRQGHERHDGEADGGVAGEGVLQGLPGYKANIENVVDDHRRSRRERD